MGGLIDFENLRAWGSKIKKKILARGSWGFFNETALNLNKSNYADLDTLICGFWTGSPVSRPHEIILEPHGAGFMRPAGSSKILERLLSFLTCCNAGFTGPSSAISKNRTS